MARSNRSATRFPAKRAGSRLRRTPGCARCHPEVTAQRYDLTLLRSRARCVYRKRSQRGSMSQTTSPSPAPASRDRAALDQRAAHRAARHPQGAVSNPATGDTIRDVAFADAHDVDARCRPRPRRQDWGATSPLRRARILTRFRELMEQHQKELAAIVTRGARQGLADAMGSVQRGIEVIEFACRRAASAQGRARRHGRPRHRRLLACCSRSASAPASRRSISRRWCRCGCSRSRSRAATRFVLKPSEKDPSPSDPHGGAAARRRACPTACSTSCTATRRRSTRSSRTPASRPCRSSARRRSRRYIYATAARARQARAGARRRQEPRGGAARRRSRVHRRRADRRRLRLRGRALHGDLGGRRGRRRRRAAGRHAGARRRGR